MHIVHGKLGWKMFAGLVNVRDSTMQSKMYVNFPRDKFIENFSLKLNGHCNHFMDLSVY